ncbi:MAG: DUF177 domain-containing protein [Oscillospiraceae bacterium]|nr:DUF177 domain-containing protein [Oscillospiraceae bacterium]
MWLDLSKVIEIPGAKASFRTDLSEEVIINPAISSFVSAPFAEGTVTNSAGVMTLRAKISASASCICDRCGETFRKDFELAPELILAADFEESEETGNDVYALSGDGIEITELLEDYFILEGDMKYLCSEDCKGLCPDCGKNLNLGPCACTKPLDPRLAVLGSLLTGEE